MTCPSFFWSLETPNIAIDFGVKKLMHQDFDHREAEGILAKIVNVLKGLTPAGSMPAVGAGQAGMGRG